MAGALVTLLKNLMADMFSVGYLDDQFEQLLLLRDESAPFFVGDAITLFCKDGKRIIRKLGQLLNKPDVDFGKVDFCVEKLKGSSACIGARRVKNSRTQFHEFCQENNRDGCLEALVDLRNEFNDLRSKFHTIFALEEEIATFFPDR